jgi:hypothetical protein
MTHAGYVARLRIRAMDIGGRARRKETTRKT